MSDANDTGRLVQLVASGACCLRENSPSVWSRRMCLKTSLSVFVVERCLSLQKTSESGENGLTFEEMRSFLSQLSCEVQPRLLQKKKVASIQRQSNILMHNYCASPCCDRESAMEILQNLALISIHRVCRLLFDATRIDKHSMRPFYLSKVLDHSSLVHLTTDISDRKIEKVSYGESPTQTGGYQKDLHYSFPLAVILLQIVHAHIRLRVAIE